MIELLAKSLDVLTSIKEESDTPGTDHKLDYLISEIQHVLRKTSKSKISWRVVEGYDSVSTLKLHRVMQGASIIAEFYGNQSKEHAEFLADSWNGGESQR